MRTAALLICLVGCSPATNEPAQEAKLGQPGDDAAIASDGGDDAGESDARETGVDAHEDAAIAVESGVDAGPDSAACIAAACAYLGAECGDTGMTCDGVTVNCGTCPTGTYGSVCGDNHNDNKCSIDCRQLNTGACPGYAWSVSNVCATGPWVYSGSTLEYRTGGMTGCVTSTQLNQSSILCCS